MDNITNQTPSISDTTYNVAADATAGIDALASDAIYGETNFTSTATVGEIVDTRHPSYRSGKVLNGVISFFERPSIIKQGTIPNASYGLIAGGSSVVITSAGFDDSYIHNASGSIGMRFTLCFKLDISATPQAAGIFKIGFRPFGLGAPPIKDPITLPTAYATMPSAEVNLADTSSVVLKVPFNWDQDYLPFNSADVYGEVGVVAYTPFSAGVSAGLTSRFTVHQWFEDVELIGPGTPFLTTVVPQIGGQEFKVAGPVSKVMSYASKITSAVGSAIPPLSAYTRPLGWVFSGIGTLASHFGWSKPNNCDSRFMHATACAGINTVTGVGTAHEFGMYANNEVDCVPYFASKDFDEMSLCYLTCIPCPIATVLLNGATDVNGTSKWVCSVDPSRFYYQGRGNYVQNIMQPVTGKAVLPTTIMAVASCFDGWRGDLVFRFKVARSKFMGGKILVGYNPYPDSNVSSAPALSRRYDYKTVLIDLRTTTVADLDVSFSYPLDFCPTNSDAVVAERNTGNVFMYVIEPLVSAGDVAPTCYVQVEVFSKCGLVFANTRLHSLAVAPTSAALVAQMGEEPESEVLKRTCGEAVLSVKQLAMRPCFGTVVANPLLVTDNSWGFTNTAYLTGANWTAVPSYLSFFSSFYRLYRGSVLHHVLGRNSNTATVARWVDDTTQIGGSPISAETRIVNSVRVPFYSYHNRCVLPPYSRGDVPTESKALRVDLTPLTGYAADAATSSGDDFQFGCFVSIPPMVSYDKANVGLF